MNPETAKWLDGPGFCEWLQERCWGLNPHTELSPTLVRRYSSALSGAHLNVWTADRILTRLGHSLTEIPDGLWRPDPRAVANTERALRRAA